MSATIMLSFQNATATANRISVIVGNALYTLLPPGALAVQGSLPFSSLLMGGGRMDFNVETGTSFNGMLRAAIDMGAKGTATMVVTNFEGNVIATWQSENGPMSMAVVPGVAIPLSGIAG